MRSLAAVFLLAFFILLAIFSIGSWSCQSSPKPNSETQKTEDSSPKDCSTFYGTFIAGLSDSGLFVRTYDKEIVAVSTVVIAAFTVILGLFTVSLARSTRVAANAAEKSAKVAQEALVGVERPILLISMPPGQAKVPSHWLDPQKPTYGIVVENVGKQIATLISGNANFIIQKDSLLPPAVGLDVPGDTACHVRIVGEINIEPNKSGAFFCQRSISLTEAEQKGLDDRSLYGFFRISLVYADPIGTLRNSIFTFAYLPPDTPGRTNPFTQVSSEDRVLTKASPDDQKKAQRKLVGDLLEFYWGYDKERSKNAQPPRSS
jgi:hypothetical protein